MGVLRPLDGDYTEEQRTDIIAACKSYRHPLIYLNVSLSTASTESWRCACGFRSESKTREPGNVKAKSRKRAPEATNLG